MGLPLACGHWFENSEPLSEDHPLWEDPGYPIPCMECTKVARIPGGADVPPLQFRQLALCAQLALYNRLEETS